MNIENICVATDGSDVAVRAAQMAVLLARTGARRIVAVSVAQPRFSLAPADPSGKALEAAADRALVRARAHVDTVARIAAANGVTCDLVVRLASAPGPEIVQIAQEYGCDLVVMGTHGPSVLDRGYVGSVAQYVLACSTAPVLVLRDPREAFPPDYGNAAEP